MNLNKATVYASPNKATFCELIFKTKTVLYRYNIDKAKGKFGEEILNSIYLYYLSICVPMN